MKARTAADAIRELSLKAGAKTGLPPETIAEKVFQREILMSTGIGSGIAVPHARIDELKKPVIAVGISRIGIDFDAPDGKPAHLIFMILTPEKDPDSQVQILSHLSNIFLDERILNESMNAESFNEFFTAIKKPFN